MPSGMHLSWLRAARKCSRSDIFPMAAGMPSKLRLLSGIMNKSVHFKGMGHAVVEICMFVLLLLLMLLPLTT